MAAGALLLLVAAPIAGAVFVLGNLLAVLVTILGVSIATAFGWIAVTHRGARRVLALVVAAVAFVAVVVGFVTALAIRDALIGLVVLAALVAAGALLARNVIGSGAGGSAAATTSGARPGRPSAPCC